MVRALAIAAMALLLDTAAVVCPGPGGRRSRYSRRTPPRSIEAAPCCPAQGMPGPPSPMHNTETAPAPAGSLTPTPRA